ncbi:unnamed protein product [Bursaphelenchus xylophilus]|uniref:(pine wood nematode) hypothetical protein n=1 Tax=Bursaphelenchus xylophilus TaxID=6326 RepID=A0A1I7SBH4_BURXY|nr:unnamed protein product [Bursaphelenchus xylophilus]CAG9121993.1 unnamed protein product [Bursaphelenchus xylophilus]
MGSKTVSKEEPEIASFSRGDQFGFWKIDKKLGEGGFGAVFKVLSRDNIAYALKVEKCTDPVRVLKMEVYVLRELQKTKAKHCCELIDSGRLGEYNYMVMTLVGASLQDLRKHDKDPSKHMFSLGTALYAGLQCLESIEEIHIIGYLHRDIKPGNFAIKVTNSRHIMILDFGMARKYLDAHGEVRRPRWAAGFRGTVRYAALSCHVSREYCRKDDLESWLYMLIEFTVGAVPWKAIQDKDEIGRNKEKAREDGSLYLGCPPQYKAITKYIDSLRYYDEPDYDFVASQVKHIMESNKLGLAVFDWEQWTTNENDSRKGAE